MEIRDAVKLLYQSEFGGGHMIVNPDKSLKRLKDEYDEEKSRKQEEKAADAVEEIGNGICRLHLTAVEEGLSLETLNQMFVKTADSRVGKISRFEKELEQLVSCCQSGELPFPVSEVKAYLKEYQRQGYPAVSHSEAYKAAYQPSYRVVAECYARYYPVLLRIDRLLRESEKKQICIAIDGKSGSGKSTLGRILQDMYSCSLFHMDEFFLRPEQRTPKRLAQPGGNVDYERFKEEIVEHLSDSEGLEYQVYDCSQQKLGRKVWVPYSRLNIIEGVYSQHPYLGEVYDLKFFYDIEEEKQIRRIRERNGEVMLKRFENQWIPMENRYFEEFNIKEKSIII